MANNLNATEAYKKAYGCTNDGTARVNASRLLANANIKAELDKKLKELTEKAGVTAEKVIEELAHIAFDDIKNYLRFYPDVEGNIKVDIKDSNTIDTRAISEVSIGKDGQFKFKLYCKDNALVQLGKNLGLFAEKLNANVSMVPQIVDDIE
jgi:phage terminase small subunit